MELFSKHTANTLSLIDLENHENNNNHIINHIDTVHYTNNTINVYDNHRQPLNSTEYPHNSDPLNTNIPPLPSINKPLPRLQRKNSVHFKQEPVILNMSTQPTSTTNQIIKLTPQQFVNFIRQFNSQNFKQTTNSANPYHLQTATMQNP